MEISELEAIKELPDFLRTDHWYNDLQHAMLVVLFRHALTATRSRSTKRIAPLIENITLYLYIHFLDEEEGLAYALSQGNVEREMLSHHFTAHLTFIDMWHDDIYAPFKSGEMDIEGLYFALEGFYRIIISHIQDTDISTYGPATECSTTQRTEIAKISLSQLPLSPFMAGAYDIVKLMDPRVAALLGKAQLSPAAMQPIPPLSLTPNVGRLVEGGRGCLRDRVAEKLGCDAQPSVLAAE